MSRAGRTGGVTMHDVAARAGVSIKTVSNVLNAYPYIRPATRERVEQAIAELGYQVNLSARNLRRGSTGIIGLAVPELRLPYFAELADSVIGAAEREGLTVLIEQTGAERTRELAVLTSAQRQLTDGLLYSPLALDLADLASLRLDFPMVLLGERIFGADADHVTMANVDAARAATEHLVARGRRRVATVGAHPGEVSGSAVLRLQGYREALEAAGLPFEPALVAEAWFWNRAAGAAAMDRLLDSGVGVDAVFAMNDALALGVLHALHRRGVAVPEQVAVIGFDDIEEAQYSAPTLSSISPGRDQIAQTAVRLLRERIDRGDAAGPPRTVVAEFTVVARESTATS
ncbi:LacI family DNA-binding transcriptional regulator [Cellulomonas sp. NTE-D12]|uniref:LacI family DNA-binding transcriptional regulator n=1 Tax=Cellulomonas sp. NTE-D12 TaxID=2962632 RepID=UPI0030815136